MRRTAIAIVVAVVGALAVASVASGCSRAVDYYTNYEDDLAVQRERYRRLGYRWDPERAAADGACVLRSTLLPDVIIGGGLLPAREREPGVVPCDYDMVFIGSKTLIVGIDAATDRIMIHAGWRELAEPARRALLVVWFRVGLTVGLEVVEEAGRGPIEAAGGAWTAVAAGRDGDVYRVEGWVRWPSDGRGERYELRRCALTEDLVFGGCEAVARIGFD